MIHRLPTAGTSIPLRPRPRRLKRYMALPLLCLAAGVWFALAD